MDALTEARLRETLWASTPKHGKRTRKGRREVCCRAAAQEGVGPPRWIALSELEQDDLYVAVVERQIRS